jgi:hypothetical protein
MKEVSPMGIYRYNSEAFLRELVGRLVSCCQNDGIMLHEYTYTLQDEARFPNIPYKGFTYHFGGNAGNAWVQIDTHYFRYNNKVFTLGFQYEGYSSKINCQRPGETYNLSQSDEIRFMELVFKKAGLFKRYTHFNRIKARGYISRSHTLLTTSDYENGDDFFPDFYKEFKDAVTIIDAVKQEMPSYCDGIEFLE